MLTIDGMVAWFRRLPWRGLFRLSCEPKGKSQPAVVLDGQSIGGEAGLADGSRIAFVEDCVVLLGELDEMSAHMDSSARALSEHVKARLFEIMDRGGMSRIEGEKSFDVARHQAWPPSRIPQGTVITETIEPGIAIGPRVLKRARVRV